MLRSINVGFTRSSKSSNRNGGIYMTENKLIALTFDDGPSNITTQVLDILEKEDIVGSFFLIGNLISNEKQPIMQRQVDMGCEICNHSLTHSDMTKMESSVIREEIDKTSALIKEMVGVSPKFFRPPYILVNSTMYENIDLPFICGVDSTDWDSSKTTQDRIDAVLSKASDGAIVLMHDLENNTRTLEALPVIISKLREEGYSFVTVSQIFEMKGIDPHCDKNALWSNVFQTNI